MTKDKIEFGCGIAVRTAEIVVDFSAALAAAKLDSQMHGLIVKDFSQQLTGKVLDVMSLEDVLKGMFPVDEALLA